MYEFFDFDYENAEFIWDDEKAKNNFTKHGVRFETAAKVFFDPNKLIRLDEEHIEEERYDIIGKAGKILFVVCMIREGSVVRIISARKASIEEKRRYEHGEDDDA